MKPRSLRCCKFFLTFFNIVCILFGLVLMGICVMNIRDRKARPEQQSMISRGVLSFLLTLGLAMVVSSVLGCVGALKENIKILYVHSCFFLFLAVVEVVVGIGGAMLTAGMKDNSELRSYFYKNTTVQDESNHAFWDRMQSENRCCGVDGPRDYEFLHRDIPMSCCPLTHPLREGGARRHLHASCIAEKTYYTRGCDDVLREKKMMKRSIFTTSGTVFILIQCACVMLSGYMIRLIRIERRKLQHNLQAHFES
ncbi:23 kDa integral membrane protein-like [Battus philenor]|uniref:23 kDa integral membrane protein-like n=1 Tax=Battus philenor TaxID=42288 RepID=UPI0035D10748